MVFFLKYIKYNVNIVLAENFIILKNILFYLIRFELLIKYADMLYINFQKKKNAYSNNYNVYLYIFFTPRISIFF